MNFRLAVRGGILYEFSAPLTVSTMAKTQADLFTDDEIEPEQGHEIIPVSLPVTGHVAVKFDYDSMDAETAAFVRDARDRVRALWKSNIATFIETGEWLEAVKARLKHGQWGPWLKAEFNWTERTAQNYMRAASRYGGNSEIISHLSHKVITALVGPSRPAQVQEEVMARLKQEKLGDEEVMEFLQERERALKAERVHARLSLAERKRRSAQETRRKRDQERDQKKRDDEYEQDIADRGALAGFVVELAVATDKLLELEQLFQKAGLVNIADFEKAVGLHRERHS
jgi:Protein of unknown function (DUF3102)